MEIEGEIIGDENNEKEKNEVMENEKKDENDKNEELISLSNDE